MNSRKKKLAAAAMLFASVFGVKKSEALNPQVNTQISKKNNLTVAPPTRKFNKDLLLKIGIPSAAAFLITGGILTWALWPKNKDVKKTNPDVNDPNKSGNTDDIKDTYDGSKSIKPVLPININKIKKLNFDNITTSDQMFNALKQIAQNYKFFGLKSSVVGFNNEANFAEKANVAEFYKQRNNKFKSDNEIVEINQKLNDLKGQLTNIEESVGKIDNQDDVDKLKKEVENFKNEIFFDNQENRRKIDNHIDSEDGTTFGVSKNDNKDGCKYNVLEYIRDKKLRNLFDIVGNLGNLDEEVQKTASRLMLFQDNEDSINKILSDINLYNDTLESCRMNENFTNTIEISKQFKEFFSPQIKIQNFKILFNKEKKNNKQNTCFEFDFYGSDNKKLWCRYNMNFRDKKVEIAVEKQTQDISVQ